MFHGVCIYACTGIYNMIQRRDALYKKSFITLVKIQYTLRVIQIRTLTHLNIRVCQFVNASIVSCMGKVTVVAYMYTLLLCILASIWTCQQMVYMYVKEENLPFMYL